MTRAPSDPYVLTAGLMCAVWEQGPEDIAAFWEGLSAEKRFEVVVVLACQTHPGRTTLAGLRAQVERVVALGVSA